MFTSAASASGRRRWANEKGEGKMEKHLERAYELISRIAVSGDAVELMAQARAELRAAWRELQKQKEEEK